MRTNPQRVLDELRQKGAKVSVRHWRRLRNNRTGEVTSQAITTAYVLNQAKRAGRSDRMRDWSIAPLGGETEVRISATLTDDNEEFELLLEAHGAAKCRDDEPFNKQLGLTIATGRAVQAWETALAEAELAVLQQALNPEIVEIERSGVRHPGEDFQVDGHVVTADPAGRELGEGAWVGTPEDRFWDPGHALQLPDAADISWGFATFPTEKDGS